MEIKTYTYNYKKICSRCVMDDTVPDINFDENGVCTFCKIHDELEKKYPINEDTEKKLKLIIDKIKKMEKVKGMIVL